MDWLRLGLVAAANAPQSAVSATMAPLDETAGIALAAAGAAAAAGAWLWNRRRRRARTRFAGQETIDRA